MATMVEDNKLFVGQVPNATSEQELRDLFGPYGEITDVMFLKNKATGQHRGCAFVTFTTPEEAAQAIAGLHEQVTLPGAKRSLIIRTAGGNRSGQQNVESGALEHKLYVAMLSHSTTVEDMRSMFEPYGVVQDAFLMHEKNDVTKSRGCGFIKYNNREDCQRAINALNGKHTDKDAPQTMQVKFAHTKAEKDANMQGGAFGVGGGMMQPFMMQNMAGQMGMGGAMGSMGWQQGYGQNPHDAYGGFQQGGPDMGGFQNGMMPQQQFGGMAAAGMGGMTGVPGMPFNPAAAGGVGGGGGGRVLTKGPPGANLFVYGIPDSYRDPDLSTLFYGFGTVVSAKVQLDLTTGRSKGFGFVSFDSVQNAQAAIAAMDGFILQGKKLNVRVKKGAGESGGGPQQRFSPY